MKRTILICLAGFGLLFSSCAVFIGGPVECEEDRDTVTVIVSQAE